MQTIKKTRNFFVVVILTIFRRGTNKRTKRDNSILTVYIHKKIYYYRKSLFKTKNTHKKKISAGIHQYNTLNPNTLTDLDTLIKPERKHVIFAI